MIELDGLKRSDDHAKAAAARRANALLAAAASAREPWLLFEEEATLRRIYTANGSTPAAALAAASSTVASSTAASSTAASASLTPDEKIIRCAATFAAARKAEYARDRVVVATRDRNATVRASAAGLEAMPLDQLRAEAAERDRAWRAAYCQSAAESALERAGGVHLALPKAVDAVREQGERPAKGQGRRAARDPREAQGKPEGYRFP